MNRKTLQQAAPSRPRSSFDVSAVPSHYDVPGAGRGDLDNAIRLDSNESAFGTSELARLAFASVPELHRYPEIGARSLREALAGHYGLDPDRIIVGPGSGDVIYSLGQAYLQPGEEVIFSEHTFDIYRVVSCLNGATPVRVPERQWKADADAMVDAVSSSSRLLCLANPDNPTGTYLSGESIRRIRDALSERAILLLDETYCHYATQPDFPNGLRMVEEFENVVVTRSFSKIFGLAALRLGWAYASPAVADVLRRYKGPFNISSPAEAAAIAALSDGAFVENAVRHNAGWRDRLTEAVSTLGLGVPESAANFIMILFPERPGRTAGEAHDFLSSRNILLRPLARWGISRGIRMTIGQDRENEAVLAALTEFMSPDRRV